jgi:pentatricopeptide repeat protein
MQPGRHTGSTRSLNSPGKEAASSEKWTTSESMWRFMGMKRHHADTTMSHAMAKEVVLNWLAPNAARWVVSQNSTSRLASAGSERAHFSVMSSMTPHLPQAPRRPRPRELETPSSLSSMFISMTLMDAYAKTSHLELVLKVLGKMPSRNIVSRTMPVASLVRGGQWHYMLFPLVWPMTPMPTRSWSRRCPRPRPRSLTSLATCGIEHAVNHASLLCTHMSSYRHFCNLFVSLL